MKPETRERLEADPAGFAALNQQIEHRGFARVDGVDLRDDAPALFRGYASVFDHPYDVAGVFTEVMRPGAFNRTLSHERKIHMLALHGGIPLASTQAGTLRLAEDPIGLKVLADLDAESPNAKSVLSAVARGDMDEMSIGFYVVKDQWTEHDDGTLTRDILETKLVEVSVVPRGANDATAAQVGRSDLVVPEFTITPDTSGDETLSIEDPEPALRGLALDVRMRFAQYDVA